MLEADRNPRPYILAIANQKGGVGKTTTAINLAAAFVEAGGRVLLIDLDPQGNASTGLGILPAMRHKTSYDLIIDELPLAETVMTTEFPGLYICPSNADLSSADMTPCAGQEWKLLISTLS